jgi:hypothetical protein
MHAAARFVTLDVHRPTVLPAIWVTFPRRRTVKQPARLRGGNYASKTVTLRCVAEAQTS